MTVTTEPVEQSVRQARPRDKALLFVGVMIMGIGQSFMFIIAAPLAREVGLSDSQYGLAFTIANLSLIIAAPFWGRKSDIWGRKPVFLVGIAGIAIGNLLLALVLQIGLWGWLSVWPLFFLLIAARTIYGATSTAIYSASSGYMADVTDRASRAQGIAFIGGGNSLGIVLGPAIGGLLAFVSALFPMYFLAVVGAAATVITYFILRETRQREEVRRPAILKFNDSRLRPFLIMRFAFWLAFTSLQFVTAFYVADRLGLTDTEEIVRMASIAMFCQALVSVFVQIVVLQAVKIPPITLLRLCFPLFAIGLFALAMATSLIPILISFAILGVALSFSHAGIGGSASLSVEPYEQGAAAGILSSATTIGIVIGPVLSTTLYDIAPNLPMLVSAAYLSLVAIYALSIKLPQPKQ